MEPRPVNCASCKKEMISISGEGHPGFAHQVPLNYEESENCMMCHECFLSEYPTGEIDHFIKGEDWKKIMRRNVQIETMKN